MFQRPLITYNGKNLGLIEVQSEIFDVQNLSALTVDSLWQKFQNRLIPEP